jgi:hypothetical protein
MSGGSLNYAYRKIEDIKSDIDEKKAEGRLFQFEEKQSEEETIIRQEIDSIMKILDKLPDRIKNLEWWLSSDIADLTYAIRIKEGNI